MMRALLLVLLASSAALAQLPPQTVTPVGTAAHNAVTVQGSASGVPMPVTGSLSVSGTADTAGNAATFNANNVCTSVLTAGEQSVGFHLTAGTLSATLTPYYTNQTGAVNCSTAGTCTTAAFSSGATLVVTNPNAASDVGVNVVGGVRQVEVCTTAYTSGSAAGVVTATFLQAASSGGGGGGSVTQGTSPWIVAGGGTAGTAATGVVTVQGIAAMTALKVDGSGVTQPISAASLPLPSTASTDASVTGLEVAQGSTTSGQNGPLVQGATTTAAPSYTTAKTAPLSLQTNGSLRAAITDALPAGSNVIGHTINDSGSTTAVTGNVTAVQGTGSNLHAQLDSGSTTTVTQGTGTNLHAVLDSGTTTVTQGTGTNLHVDVDTALPAGTNVIGHVIADSGSTTAVTGNVTVTQGTGTNLHTVIDSGTVTTSPPANASENIAQVNGVTTLTGAGVSGTGSIRVTDATSDGNVLATANSGRLQVDVVTGGGSNSSVGTTGSGVPASGTYVAANQGGNLTGLNLDASGNLNVNLNAAATAGATISDGILVPVVEPSGYAAQPQDKALNVTISPNSALKFPAAPKVQNVLIVNENGRSPAILAPQQAPSGFEQSQVVSVSPNPAPVCPFTAAISQTGSTKIIAGQPGHRVFICSVLVVSTTAQSLALVDGTGSTCGSAPTTAIIGSTTVANGPALAANGGWTLSGNPVLYTAPDTGSDVCLLQSGAGNVGGAVTYTLF